MFCGDNPFVTRCNCLSLSISDFNERHNFTALPYSKNGIMNEMTGRLFRSLQWATSNIA